MADDDKDTKERVQRTSKRSIKIQNLFQFEKYSNKIRYTNQIEKKK